uniref:Transmembrane and coiled-coil domain-containing protein 4 n=1 Tax=Aceria tosichella TaxID=561515 RepID=A0A6G1S5V8_9ACAR
MSSSASSPVDPQSNGGKSRDHDEDHEETNSQESSIVSSIDDVVAFSLCALCSIRLNHLYPEDYHESFRTNTIKRMVKHFKLPPRVENSVHEFVADDEFTFLSSIKNNHGAKTFNLIVELVLFSILSGSHDARMHYLIVDVAELLGIPRDLVEIHCESIYEHLLKAQSEEQTSDDEKYREKRDTRKKIKKYLAIGLTSLGGGLIIGVTGGLAAPVVISSLSAMIGVGSVAMSATAISGVVGSLFGIGGAGLVQSKMRNRIGDLEEFAFQSLNPENDQTSLTITIAISGWITDDGENRFSEPWKYLNHSKEQYCLQYESKYLLELSQAMDYLLSFVVSYATQEALKYTFLAGLISAIAWPTALLSMSNIIDNPWDCCLGRSAEAGKHLADVLMSRQQGKRPVSLIGFSLGARVIFSCLQELSRRKNSEGIICDIVLLGAPVSASLDQWKPLARIISGRVINGYSVSDWLLKFLYRTSSAAIHVAGLQKLCWQDKRVTNVDLTPLVGGHSDYYKKLTEILEYVNIKTLVKIEDDLVIAERQTKASTSGIEAAAAQSEAAATTMISDEPSRPATSASDSLAEKIPSATSDSGIERTISESTNLSASPLHQQTNSPTPLALDLPIESLSTTATTTYLRNDHQVRTNSRPVARNTNEHTALGYLDKARLRPSSLVRLADRRQFHIGKSLETNLTCPRSSALQPIQVLGERRLRIRSKSI